MNWALEISLLLKEAANVDQSGETLNLYGRSIDLVRQWQKAAPSDEASYHALARIRKALARERRNPLDIRRDWASALDAAESGGHSVQGAVLMAEIAIDAVQDPFNPIDDSEKLGYMKRAFLIVDSALNKASGEDRGTLLVSKAALLRHKARLVSDGQRRKLLLSAEGATRRALEYTNGDWAFLEAALTQFAMVRRSATDQVYLRRLKDIRALLNRACEHERQVCLLAASQVYRVLGEPDTSCEFFERAMAGGENRRRIWQSAYRYGELAMNLWFNEWDEQLSMRHRTKALQLLEMAVSSGVSNARTHLAIAYLHAAEGKPDQSVRQLRTIFNVDGSVDWNIVARHACESPNKYYTDQGFALGLNSAFTWSRLGTYVRHFLHDNELGKFFYRQAERLEPNNQIVLTNLARALIGDGDHQSLDQAKSLLSRAGSVDRNFPWRRFVQLELDAKMRIPQFQTYIDRQSRKLSTSFRELRSEFQQVSTISDSKKRGLAFESLMYSLSRLYFPDALNKVQIPQADGGRIERDITFTIGETTFALECEWENRKTQKRNVEECIKRSVREGTVCVLASMSGFAPLAINFAKHSTGGTYLLLIGPDEIRWALAGATDFEQVLLRKLTKLREEGQAYIVFKPDGSGN